MGFVLKLCVYSSLVFVLIVNILYFCSYYEDPIQRGHYYRLLNFQGKTEPLTIRGNRGRLGNQMFVFATLYGLGKLNNRKISVMPNNYEALCTYFEINFPQVDLKSFRVREPWLIGHWLKPEDSSIPVTANIVSGNMYPTSYTFFDHVREDVRNIFKFKQPFKEHADNVLRHVKKIRPWTRTFVCVHVRRGDYLRRSAGGWLRAANGREVDIDYFQKSIQYYRNKYRNITFLAVSDDRDWTKQNLSPIGILTLPKSETPGHDLALLASCNHTIMTYGSFGFWGSYLAGGEVMYFSDFIKPGSKIEDIFVYQKMYPKEWIGISTTPKGFWENYTNPFMDYP